MLFRIQKPDYILLQVLPSPMFGIEAIRYQLQWLLDLIHSGKLDECPNK